MIAKNRTLNTRILARIGSACVLCAMLAAPAVAQEGNPEVNVTDYGTVDLAVQDTDLAQVLQMLAIQSKKNIIASKSVSATVTANLFDVTFYEAMDAILRVNGYGYVEEGNFIYVYTLDELEAIQEAQRHTESRIYELQYLAAIDAQEFVAPMLSDVGQSSYRGDVPVGFKPDVGDGGADSYSYPARLVVNDYVENLDAISTFLTELDTAPQQVLVESTILQTNLDEANAYGVDFSIIADMDFTDLTNPLAAVNNLLAGDDPDGGFQPPDNQAYAGVGTVGNTAGPATLKIGVIDDDFSFFLRLLDEVTDSVVLARPKIMALNRQRAEVLVGARVGYLSTTATETTTTQTVEFLDTGIQLIFRPFISPDGMIRLELAPSVSEASLRSVTDSNGLVVTIPDELTNELTTNVRVRDGQTLVLGGLFRERTVSTRRQVPLLGDLPILGLPFRGNDDAAERDEIIFLITPSIVHDEILWEMGEDTLAYTDRARVGARNGLLPFSRMKRTANFNKDAIDAYNQGDTEKALYYINNSLRLDPRQPEMLKLREKITGTKDPAYESSMMERVLREEIGPLFPDQVTDVSDARLSIPPASTHWESSKTPTQSFGSYTPTSVGNEMDHEFFSVLESIDVDRSAAPSWRGRSSSTDLEQAENLSVPTTGSANADSVDESSTEGNEEQTVDATDSVQPE